MNIELGPALSNIGRIAGIGPAIGPISLPINEGPVSLADFKNTMPLQIGPQPVEIVRFNNPVQPPQEVETIASVRSFLAQARIEEKVAIEPQPVRQAQAMYWFVDVPKPEQVVKPAEIIMPQAEPLVMPARWPKAIENPAPRVVAVPTLESVGVTQPVLQEVDEVVEEKKQTMEEALEEEQIMERRLYLEDKEVSAVRRHEIRQAIIRARVEADRLGLKKIAGWLVAKFLPGEHQGNRSQIVKKTGPDGSYQETIEAIYGAGELESEEQAVKRFNMVVAEKKPVKRGKEGAPVAGHDVARVLKYFFVKVGPAEQTVTRATKKQQAKVMTLAVAYRDSLTGS